MVKDQFLSSFFVFGFATLPPKIYLMGIIKCNVTEISGKGGHNKPFSAESPLGEEEDGSVP